MYLTTTQINEAADAACTSYEWTASWRDAGRAAREFIADEFGVKPTDAQVATAVRIAQAKWEGIKMAVQRAVA